MKLTFLGTRGNITRRNQWHYFHASLLVTYKQTHIVIDCGSDWLKALHNPRFAPHAIFVTHAHSDHAGGLVDGAPCSVYATAESWQVMKNYAIKDKQLIEPRKLTRVGELTIEAFTVDHSLNAPAVGYRVSDSKNTFFYVPDLIKIHDEAQALADVQLYIGDGAIVTRTILERMRDHTMIGHTPIEKQLRWCKAQGVKRAIFSHCGSEIVKHDEESMKTIVSELGKHYGVSTELAYDGMVVILE